MAGAFVATVGTAMLVLVAVATGGCGACPFDRHERHVLAAAAAPGSYGGAFDDAQGLPARGREFSGDRCRPFCGTTGPHDWCFVKTAKAGGLQVDCGDRPYCD